MLKIDIDVEEMEPYERHLSALKLLQLYYNHKIRIFKTRKGLHIYVVDLPEHESLRRLYHDDVKRIERDIVGRRYGNVLFTVKVRGGYKSFEEEIGLEEALRLLRGGRVEQ